MTNDECRGLGARKDGLSAFVIQHSSLIGFFLVVALAWTWPVVTRLSWRIPHDPGDPILNTWILWWNTQAVPFTAAWWSPPVFYPMPGALALSEHLAGIAVFTTPLQKSGWIRPSTTFASVTVSGPPLR